MFEIRTIYALALAHMVLVLTLFVLFGYFLEIEWLSAIFCIPLGASYGRVLGKLACYTEAGEY